MLPKILPAMIAAFSFATLAFSQTSPVTEVLDFKTIKLEKSTSMGTGFQQFPAADSVISFDNNDSWIIISKLKNIKTLSFDYCGNVTEDFNLIFSIKEPSKSDYEVLTLETRKKILKEKVYPLSVSIQKYDEFDLKIRVTYNNGGSGVFGINNLNAIKYSQKEVEDRRESKENEARILEKSNIVYNQKMGEAYNAKVSLLAIEYKNQIVKVRDIQKKANTLAALANTVQLVHKRTLMSDPNEYEIFRDKIKFIRDNTDSVQKVILANVVDNFKTKDISVQSSSSNTSEGFRKFAMIANDVANLVTGGQFKGVVSSLQSLVGAIFNKGSLTSKFPALENEINEKGKVTKTVLNKVNVEKIETLTKQGIELQNFFTSFFSKLDSSRTDFKNIVQEFQYFSNDADPFVHRVNELHKQFYLASKININSQRYYGNVDQNYYDSLGRISNRYFSSMKVDIEKLKKNGQIATKESELDDLRFLLREINDMDKESINLSTRLANLFTMIKDDLNKPNPFGMLDKNDKSKSVANPAFGKSFEEFDKYQGEAKGIMENLEDNLKYILPKKVTPK